MSPLVWGEVDMTEEDHPDEYVHHFRALIKSEAQSSSVNARKLRALVREVTALASSLPLYLESSIFFRIDESRMDVMKCVITGPEETPYAHGCFLFDLYCSNEYPALPPQVNFQTTGGGTVRFNPNLYNCGKVCLSLLGTWRGGPNEQWNEATTTLLQVLVSIQSLIFVSQPFFNEPGYEALMHTTKGDLQSAAYNETIRLATVTFAMVDMIKNPPIGFEQVVRRHFTLKAHRTLKDVIAWLKEAQTSHSTPEYFAKLKEITLELKLLLLTLDMDAMRGLQDPHEMHANVIIVEKEVRGGGGQVSSSSSSASFASSASSTQSSSSTQPSSSSFSLYPPHLNQPSQQQALLMSQLNNSNNSSNSNASLPSYLHVDDEYSHPANIYPHLKHK